eukprot:4518414-Amphidinium_carterae.1
MRIEQRLLAVASPLTASLANLQASVKLGTAQLSSEISSQQIADNQEVISLLSSLRAQQQDIVEQDNRAPDPKHSMEIQGVVTHFLADLKVCMEKGIQLQTESSSQQMASNQELIDLLRSMETSLRATAVKDVDERCAKGKAHGVRFAEEHSQVEDKALSAISQLQTSVTNMQNHMDAGLAQLRSELSTREPATKVNEVLQGMATSVAELKAELCALSGSAADESITLQGAQVKGGQIRSQWDTNEQHMQTERLINIEAIVCTVHKLLLEVDTCRKAAPPLSPTPLSPSRLRPADSPLASAVGWVSGAKNISSEHSNLQKLDPVSILLELEQ